MNKSIHVHFKHKPEEKYLNFLKNKLPKNLHLTFGKPLENHDTIDFLISGRPEKAELEQCANLKAVIIPFAGVPEATQEVMKDFPHVAIHNLHHNALPTAENALALLLAASKHIIRPHNALKNCDWQPRYEPNPSMLLNGKTALILGYGSIGKSLAKMLYGLSMKIIAIRNSLDSPEKDDHTLIFPSHSLHTLLPEASILINTLPLTHLTENFIGEKEFTLLPEGAIVVNIGRGKVIDQESFYNALRSGHLGAAAIDVWYHYPDNIDNREYTKPADFPFWELDNVVLSPHRAGGLNSADTEYLRMEHLARLLTSAAHNEPLPNRVNISRGY